jgi:hypothetical protein
MSQVNQIHLLPERDRMMAETYSQNADGSNNPTGEAQSQEGPQVHRSTHPAAKAVSKADAETKVVEPGDAENKSVTVGRKATAKKKG